jgi:flagellar basal body P-ring formation protein FlgA
MSSTVPRACSARNASACAAFVTLTAIGLVTAAQPSFGALDESLANEVRKLATDGTRAVPQASRVEVRVGQLDARLKLAPCEKIEPYLPANARLWGRTRIGLRCVRGPSPWNVYLPITVKVYGTALVAATTLPAGTVLSAADLRESEVDWAEEPGDVHTQPESVIGRTLARPLPAGHGLRASHRRARQWFAPGDPVRITTTGAGYAVSAAGEALTAGIEGQNARVRTEGGRVVVGLPVAKRQLEVMQ